ncbi:MAG TPA: PQQ-binding-like beta-propeller repeat protein [Polyangiaceae bacterium]|nr:PQQ-binding-like beta-propeller repeat protein [Polyangiaceae bacterium]
MSIARGRRALALLATLAVVGLVALAGRAQTVDAERSRTLTVGLPPGARAEQVDAARTSLSRTRLPASGLRVAWRAPAGAPLEHAPLVDARGTTYAVTMRGDALAVGPDGAERWRSPTGGLGPGPATLLADDTLVFVDATGVAIAVREGTVRWRAKIGAADPDRPAPLPLVDGGVVVATSREVSVLDAEGHERARTTFPEPCFGPLISALGRVVAVATSGVVWAWAPGAPEPTRAGSFISAPDSDAAMADDHTLVAVVGGRTTLAAVDLLHGTTASRAIAPGGVWRGAPAMRGAMATLVLASPSGESALSLDASGRELSRALLFARSGLARGDAGAPPAGPAAAEPLLIDPGGTLVFTTPEGAFGASPMGASSDPPVEVLTDVCPRPGALGGAPQGQSPVAGLAPLATGSFVAACRSGTLVAIAGSVSSPSAAPSTPAPPDEGPPRHAPPSPPAAAAPPASVERSGKTAPGAL